MSLDSVLIICGVALLLQTTLLYFRRALMAGIGRHPEAAKVIAIVFALILFACAVLPLFYLAS